MAIDPPAELQFSDAEGDCTFSKTGSVISLTPSCTLAASGTATGTMAADIIDIKEKLEEIKNGTYWANQGVDVPTDPTAATGVPAFTNGPSGYLMALNIATNDGHMVHYGNDNFWESQTGTGGATGSSALRWTKDFKDTTVFNMAADQIMVAVHVDGVVKAWREYHASNKGASLQSYLANPRLPGPGSCSRKITNGIISTSGKDDIDSRDPLLRNYDELFANCDNECTGGPDYNRLSAKSSAGECYSNQGWGIGTWYDYPGTTNVPRCDAVYHEDQTWGDDAGAPVGGIIGSDCTMLTCPHCQQSGDQLDYAIFVKA